jgi:hypothetical protein
MIGGKEVESDDAGAWDCAVTRFPDCQRDATIREAAQFAWRFAAASVLA